MRNNYGSFEERTGVNSTFFDKNIKTLVSQVMTSDDPMMVVKTAYPRIYKMIVLMWGSKELHERLTKMVALDTEGREGFDKPVGQALMSIHDTHMTRFGFEPIWTIPNMKRDTW